MIWIAVDAMGGDDAPRHVVDGAVAASRDVDLGVVLVGPSARIDDELRRHPDADSESHPDCSTRRRSVTMDESPSAALRRKPGASIRVAADSVARGDAAGLFSAGHTGATVMAAHAAFGMLPGVDRPALAATIPTPNGSAVLLDVGASVECRPQHLLQFAVMGSVYARVALGIDAPRIGLLSIGEEATKGNELTREAHRLLKASLPPFIGNVEARDVYSGQADVIVCDGFTGNVALKISEGLVDLIEGLLRTELSAITAYSEHGGAPLLGVNGVAIVGHGRSSAKAVRNGVVVAHRFASDRVIQRLEGDIAAFAVPHSVIAFIFPGQGAQKVGMGRALAEAFPICRETFDEADAALGEPLSRIIFEGPEDQLTLTENTQPAILAVSTAAARFLASRGLVPAFVAGHSLGEYSANVAAGTFSFADALRLVRRRGRYMQEAVPVGEGAMAAILGLDAEQVAQACARGGGRRRGQPREPERRRTGGDRRRARRGGARGRARQGARAPSG